MLIRFGHHITIRCAQPTPLICLLTLHDERRDDLDRQGPVITDPPVPVSRYRDLFGNTCLRMLAPQGDFSIRQDCTVRDSGLPDAHLPDARETPIADLPDETLIYLLGSRYCETDRLSQTAWNLFGNLPPGWARVQAICDYVKGHIRFDYMAARATRTAGDAQAERVGVCRDFAHLGIALCRCMNIPARYVNGYLGDIGVPVVDPMDFSAWMEVWLDGRWVTFDPRNNTRRIGRVKVSHGRDAADVPLVHSFGPHTLQRFTVWAYDLAAPPPNLPD
ncbi:MAG: transglutaminase family protein [Paracoccaceae bacterium]|nr:MAG: transglutaminase family protein [Paracoccaceae bacterium]